MQHSTNQPPSGLQPAARTKVADFWVALAWVITAFAACNGSVRCQGQELAELLQPLVDAHAGKVAVAVKHLDGSARYSFHADEPMPTASLIKLPLMVTAYQQAKAGKVNLDASLALREEDKVPGSGVLTDHFSAGTVISLRDAIRLMIVFSDNTATNLVIDQVGLPSTTELMDQLGLPETQLHSKVYRRDSSIAPERSQKYGLGSTTANDMLLLLEKLSRNELVDAEACQAMAQHLYACDDKSKFPRFLPGIKIAHKTGSVNASRCDAGWIDSPSGRIVLCVLTTDNQDQSWGDSNQAELLCGQIAQATYGFFNPNSSPNVAVDEGPLASGANGLLVEGLQRTLNTRMHPAPNLSVDGDFGPATESAVVAFQRSKGLEPNGKVDAATWAALGPIVEESDEAQPAATPPRLPADDFAGTPYVTCKSWAITDAHTGEMLWGFQAEEPRDPASTTKIMTARLVLKLAETQPEILEETIIFSQRADATIGSSATVRAGERITVGDLLFGLLLPSGNDAAVALAEHFGLRVATEATPGFSAANEYDSFVAAMNQEAQELGLAQTHFENPNGLTANGHQTSARDLGLLASRAMQSPLFRKIVNTPRYQCSVMGATGYTRPIHWTNTNQLLGIEGYEGVKTGTTDRAGACLVALGERSDRRLIITILGATSSDSRYSDVRNLFRWAWNQVQPNSSVSPK